MSFDLNALLNQLGRDKGIDKNVLVEAIESAMLSAARKHYGHHLNLETRFDEEAGTIEVLQFKLVVDQVVDPDNQISIADARKEFDPDAREGDELGKKLDTQVLGRIAAQTAKQVIVQKVRDAERSVIFAEYKDSKGDLVNGIVQRYERGDLIVNLGRTEAVLPKREQIPRERYRQGDRIRAMVLDVDPTKRGSQIILTRSHPDFLMKLFGLEVPEITEGTIQIKGVSRDPGFKAKIAVYSTDSNIDPVGACVGVKGSRVHAVGQELRGERIDIIPWSVDNPSFVARSLSVDEVARVVVDEDKHSMEVVVPDDQLSYAIGRRGQNVRLASKLTGWQIDVRSVSVAEEEAKRARAALEAIPGLQFTMAELLYQAGYRSPRDIAKASVEDLLEIDEFTNESAEKTIASAKLHVEDLESQGISPVEIISDFDSLYLAPEFKEKLIKGGIKTIQQLAMSDEQTLLQVPGIQQADLEVIKTAVDGFFSRENVGIKMVAKDA